MSASAIKPCMSRGDINLLLLASTSLTQEKTIMTCLQPSIPHRQQEPLRGESRGERQKRDGTNGDKPVEEAEQYGLCHKSYSGLTPLSMIILPGSDTACFPT